MGRGRSARSTFTNTTTSVRCNVAITIDVIDRNSRDRPEPVRGTPPTVPFGEHTALSTWRRRRALLILPCLVAGMALSACGSGTSFSSGRTEVRSANVPGLGHVLVDGAGYTLYVHMPDRRRSSRCFGICAKQWPPLVLSARQRRAIAGPGVRSSLVGTVRRPDGDRQVTYNGWPLYLTAHTTPGQADGQGSTMGIWYTISVTGAVDHGILARKGT